MVESTRGERTYTLTEIEIRLRRDGFSQEKAKRVVTGLEPKPITIREASEKYGMPKSTIRCWLQRGHLHEIARIRHCGPNGGKVVIDENELRDLLANPPKIGRPVKELGE